MNHDLCLTTAQLAAMFGVSKQAARAWAAAGRITCIVSDDGSRLFSASHAACLLARHERGQLAEVGDIRPGDVLSLDGTPVQVTLIAGASYFDAGHREGMAVEWRRGTARGVFARSAGDRIVRLRQADSWAAAA